MPPSDYYLGARAPPLNVLDAYVTVFIVCQLVGLCGCTLMLLTALLSSNTPRHPTWFSFVFSFLLSTTSFSLLFLFGKLRDYPPFPLCLTQASLIYAAPPLTAGTTVALVAQVYFNVKNVMTEASARKQKHSSLILLVAPYMLYISMAIGCLVVGLQNPDIVQKEAGKGYCNFKLRIPSRIASVTVAIFLIPSIALEAATCVLLWKCWSVGKKPQIPISTIIHVLVFSVIAVLCIGLGIGLASMKVRDRDLNIILGIVPVAVILIFGTQNDLWKFWMFWNWNWSWSWSWSCPPLWKVTTKSI